MKIKKLSYFIVIIIVIFFNSPFHIFNIFIRLNNLDNIPALSIKYDKDLISITELKKIVSIAIPYYHDFKIYQTACYIPDIKDTLNKGMGDCKARTTLYSSLLKARHIDHSIMYSMVHWWIDFKDRTFDSWEEKYEDKNDALWDQNTGLNWNKVYRNLIIIYENMSLYRKMLFDEMPFNKKIFFLITFFLLFLKSYRIKKI